MPVHCSRGTKTPTCRVSGPLSNVGSMRRKQAATSSTGRPEEMPPRWMAPSSRGHRNLGMFVLIVNPNGRTLFDGPREASPGDKDNQGREHEESADLELHGFDFSAPHNVLHLEWVRIRAATVVPAGSRRTGGKLIDDPRRSPSRDTASKAA